MEVVAIIISLCSLIGGLVGYYRHDKKIKEQEVRLNAFQIKEWRSRSMLGQHSLLNRG